MIECWGGEIEVEVDHYNSSNFFEFDNNSTPITSITPAITSSTATNTQGKRVEGVVCSGWFKGATVRITGRVSQ